MQAPTVTQNCWSARVWNLAMVGCSKMARLSRRIRATCSDPVNHQLLYVLYLVRRGELVMSHDMMTFKGDKKCLTCGAR